MRKGIAQKLLLGGATGAAMLLTVGTAQAVEFKFGEMSLVIDNTASIGVGVRTSKQNCHNVNSANGGCPVDGPAGGIDFGVNDDDGNINTDQWDIYSTPVKLTTDFEMKWRNYGAFVRTKLFYDYWVHEEIGTRNNRFGARPITDAARGDQARRFGGRGADVLDAFVYGNFDVAGNPVTLRAGKQVINWGESLFIPGGISSYLPVDVSALRTPGSELKEAFLPVPALYGSIGLPGNMQVEAFWQFGWERTRLDACGTFFSGTDAACEGGQYVMSVGEFGNSPIIIRRQASDEGDDTGTFGVALKHYADWLGAGTDLGLYYVNQSLTVPVGTFTAGNFPGVLAGLEAAAALPPGALGTTVTSFCTALGHANFGDCNNPALGNFAPGVAGDFNVAFIGAANTKRFLTQYVNDVDSYGFSFNTSIPLLGGSAFSGEINYTPDMPFALNDVNQNCHDLNAAGVGDFIIGVPGFEHCRPGAVAPTGPGATIQGYDFRESITGQFGTISTLSGSQPLVDMIGGDILILVFNAGFQYIPNLDSATNRLAIPRSAISDPNPISNAILGSGACAAGGAGCPIKFADDFSWGYRLLTSVDYNNALGTAWTLSPSVAWSHDVSGYSAGPVGPGFVQGKKVVSLGLTANLRSVWRANVQYTHNMGNEFRNFSKDKDFMTMTVSYAF